VYNPTCRLCHITEHLFQQFHQHLTALDGRLLDTTDLTLQPDLMADDAGCLWESPDVLYLHCKLPEWWFHQDNMNS
jgi:hypothetical protein